VPRRRSVRTISLSLSLSLSARRFPFARSPTLTDGRTKSLDEEPFPMTTNTVAGEIQFSA